MAEKDISQKILLAYDDVFADVVNGLLFGGRQVVLPEDLEDQAPRAAYKADGRLREVERDVAKRWVRGNARIACLGLENQTRPDPDMALRAYAYDGVEYRTQLLRENAGRPRYPVVTLVLYFGYEGRWDQPTRLRDALDVPEELRPFVPDVGINLFEVAYLSDEQVGRFRSDFRVVADYFVQMRRSRDYVPSPERLRHVEAVMQLLSVMTGDTRFEDALNFGGGADGGGVSNMCELLDRIEARGMALGEARGEIKGAIRLYRDEMGLLPSDIELRVMRRFGLGREEAERYVAEALGLELA